jgi:hypothetical protein
MKRLSLNRGALVAAGLILACGCTTERVETLKKPPSQPPAVTQESPVASPGPQYVWIGGHYEWSRRWVRIPGAWMVPPRPNAIWVSGQFVRNARGWVWIQSHWEF